MYISFQVLASLQNILGVSLPGADGGPRPGSLPCTQVQVMKILNTSSLAFTILFYVQAAALIGDLEPADLVGVVIGEVLAGLPNLQEQVGILCKDEIVGNSNFSGALPCAMLQTPTSGGARLWQEGFRGASLHSPRKC